MGQGNISVIVLGLTALILGIGIKLLIHRRRFYRRNQAGLQSFKNYRTAVSITFIERVLMVVGNLLIVVGMLIMGVKIFVSR